MLNLQLLETAAEDLWIRSTEISSKKSHLHLSGAEATGRNPEMAEDAKLFFFRTNALMIRGLRSLGSLVASLPVVGVLIHAVRNYVFHQSANQAGSLALSALLAMFPLLLLLSAAAGFFGQPGEAAALAEQVIGYAP